MRTSREIRKRALELMASDRARGTKAGETASALGVHLTTLLYWQREREQQSGPFAEARIAEHRPPKGAAAQPLAPTRALRVMVIDGLDMATLEALLRGLS